MKKTINIIFLLAAFIAAGCATDKTDPADPAKGNPDPVVTDGVVCRLQIGEDDQTGGSEETRTNYGPLTNGAFPIYWTNGDQVKIFCTKTTPQEATVTVSVTEPNQREADLSNTGMAWGEAATYDFYAFYPAKAVKSQSGTLVAATIPSVQTNSNGGCNMDYAFMCAKAKGVERGAEVPFAFRPLMTAVTIELTFPQAATVQKLVLSSQDPLTGSFVYDMSADKCVPTVGETSKVLALHMETAGQPYMTMTAGSKIRITAFMLPCDIRGLTITAVTSEGITYSRSTEATLKAGYKYSLTINDMQAQTAAPIGPDWMKFLPDNVHLSQVSIPGSHDACAIYGSHYEYKSDINGDNKNQLHFKWLQNLYIFGWINVTKSTKAQELSLEEQLKAGVRMFDLRPGASDNSVSDLAIYHGAGVLGDPTLGGFTYGGSGRQALSPFRIAAVLHRLSTFLAAHPDETILVHMKYENTSGSAAQTGWQRSVVNYIKQFCAGRIADFSPTMTLADARGKILFIIREDYKANNGGEYLGAYLNWTADKVVFETTLAGNTAATAPIIVNDLYALSSGSSGGVSKYQAIDRCVNYTYNSTDASRWAMNYVSCYDTEYSSISGIVGSIGVTGDLDYTAAKYNKYMADKIAAASFRGNVGIVLMDFAGAANASMTYSSSWSYENVYGDQLVKALLANNNKWPLRCKE